MIISDNSMTEMDLFLFKPSSNELILAEDSVIELLGVLPYEILLILRDSYPEGKNFKDLKKDIENRLQDWLSKKNKSTSFTDQAIYYQLRKLKELGFIDTIPEKFLDENDRLITSQKYKLNALNFVLDLSRKRVKGESDQSIHHIISTLPPFLTNFAKEDKFKGILVLGENSKDAPFLVPITLFLKKFFDFSGVSSFVFYDKKVLEDPNYNKRRYYLSQNLILLGGPNVNGIFLSTVPEPEEEHKNFNESLPIRFLHAPDSGIIIQNKKVTIYSKEKILGVIQLVTNPWNGSTKILTIGGSTRVGTEAAVKELTRSYVKIDKQLTNQGFCLIEAIIDDKGQFFDSKIIE